MNNTYKPVSYQQELRHRKEKITYSIISFIAGAVIGGISGVFIFLNITGGSAVPSQEISAPTLPVATVISEDSNNPEVVEVTEAPVDETPEADGGLPTVLYRIVSEESEAKFSVYETYPIGTAVGRTNQIAGDILVDFNSPLNSQLGTIRINLRTLVTDDPDRDKSIRCCVLLTSRPEYEFADFVPGQIVGLPETIEVGQTANFQVLGNLTLKGVTNPVTFDVTINSLSFNELKGIGFATVNRTDFGILNNAENGFDYHGVEDNVELEFVFVARAVQE